MKKTMILSAALIAVMLSAPAYAFGGGKGGKGGGQGGPGQMGQGGPRDGSRFAQIDTNGDGYIDQAEFIASHKKMFDKMDVDGDGKVSQQEVHESRVKMKEKMQEKRQMMQGNRQGFQGQPNSDDAE